MLLSILRRRRRRIDVFEQGNADLDNVEVDIEFHDSLGGKSVLFVMKSEAARRGSSLRELPLLCSAQSLFAESRDVHKCLQILTKINQGNRKVLYLDAPQNSFSMLSWAEISAAERMLSIVELEMWERGVEKRSHKAEDRLLEK